MLVRLRPRRRRLCARVWRKRLARALHRRGRPAVRGGARNGQRLDGPLGARRESGAEGRASRTAALPALGSSSGSHHRAVDSEPVPGPVAFAVRAVDAGSGAAVAGPTVRRARVGLDGGALFAGLGSDATEAGAARLRTKPGRSPISVVAVSLDR